MIGGDHVRLPVLRAAKPAGALAVQRGSVGVKVSEQAHLCAVVNYLVQDVKCQVYRVRLGIRPP
jgi:hypothetical protein